MSSKDRMEEWTRFWLKAADSNIEAAKVAFINYAPTLVDMGAEMDRLYIENERLRAIVDLIELKEERDRLAKRVAELETS